MDLIVVGIGTGNWVWGRSVQEVVVGNVGSETTEEGGGSGVSVEVSEQLSSGAQVGGPSEPSSMASVDVGVDANGVELLESVGDTLGISGLCTGTLSNVQVGDHVGQRIRFDNSNNADLRVL